MYDLAAIAILLGVFFGMILLKLPITISLLFSTGLTLLYIDIPLMTMVQQMAKSINSFSLMAVPFFILAGEIMGGGGISDRMVATAKSFVGHLRGGMAHVNILSSMLFGHLSGSALADISSVGPIEIPLMTNNGYDKEFAVSTTIASSTLGILIPPSHNMIIYSLAAGGVSVGALFMAGLGPGLMLGVLMMVACYFISVRRGYPVAPKMPMKERIAVTLDAMWALFTAVIILVGTTIGLFTATEAAAIACVYAFIVAKFVYKELKMKEIPGMLWNTVKSLAMVFGLIGAAGAFGWVLAYLKVPAMITNLLLSITSNKMLLLLLINIMLLILGCIMDMAPLIVIVTPILLPAVQSFGMSSVQFGVMLIFNLAVGLCTPPVGSALFMGCIVGKTTVEKVIKPLLPMYLVMIAGLLLVTYIPEVSLLLPRLMGYNV